MREPKRFVFRILIFLISVVVLISPASPLYAPLHKSFSANPALNGLILGVLVIGIFINLRQLAILSSAVNWINGFKKEQTQQQVQQNKNLSSSVSTKSPPNLIQSIANLFNEKKANNKKIVFSAASGRTILDSIYARLDESREISRYFIGLTIFLGLLGTFWGLMSTVASIGSVISGLNVSGDNVTAVFDNLKSGLEAPLSGMGTAFSSSLLGLGGSLILGFVDLQTGQAQNHFYNGLEDWIMEQTKLTGSTLGSGDGEGSVSAYTHALLEQTADSLDSLQRLMTKNEEERHKNAEQTQKIAEMLSLLSEHLSQNHTVMRQMMEVQQNMPPAIEKLAAGVEKSSTATEALKAHLGAIEMDVGRIVTDSAAGREYLLNEIRSEVKLLARTIAALESKG